MNEWIFRLITLILTVLSPELRVGLVEWLDDLEVRAKKTDNPWDDMLVGVLKSILL